MKSEYTDPNLSELAARWWMLVARGSAAVLLGVVALMSRGSGLIAVAIAWGAYAIIDGVFSLMLADHAARTGRNWVWALIEGVAGVAAGAVSFVWPHITALILFALVAVQAVGTGAARIVAAIALRRRLANEWLLGASGALSIAFGVFMLDFPVTGARAMVLLLGGYALVLGMLLIGLGLRLYRWSLADNRTFPPDGMPNHA